MSTNKTALGLNNWVLSDKPLMEEFNKDNKIIDEKLREHDQALHTETAWTPTAVSGIASFTPTQGFAFLTGKHVLLTMRIDNLVLDGSGDRVIFGGLPFPVKGHIVFFGSGAWGAKALLPHVRGTDGDNVYLSILDNNSNFVALGGKFPAQSGALQITLSYITP